jgi:hypothetical protein
MLVLDDIPRGKRASAGELGRKAQSGSQPVVDDPRALRCRSCGTPITHPDALFAMRHASAVQVFPNPAGIVYEVLTARYAAGLILSGPPTTEFTWFAGYAWQVASCARCGVHLGWRYTAVHGGEPPLFYGLLRQRLTD